MEMNIITIFSISLFLVLFSLLINYRHILLTLLALELMTIIIISLIFQLSAVSLLSFVPILTLLTFSACEASLGLALLVLLVRASGNDYVNLMPLFKS